MKREAQFKILTLQDYGKVAKIFSEVFPDKYKAEFDDCWIRRMTNQSVGIFDESVLKGFVLVRQTDTYIRIEFLGVSPAWQKDGIGTMLLKHVLQSRSPISLTPVNDIRVINWYKKHGFILTGESHINPFTQEIEEDMVYFTDQKSVFIEKTICSLSFPTAALA